MAEKRALEPRRDTYKLWFDLSLLVLAHLLLLPLWLLLWTVIPFVIWIGDRGPIFYRQKRSGKDGQVFTAPLRLRGKAHLRAKVGSQKSLSWKEKG